MSPAALCKLLVWLIWLPFAILVCPEECRCSLDVKARSRVLCPQGFLSDTIPVRLLSPHLQVLEVREGDRLTLGPLFQGFGRLEELRLIGCQLPAIGSRSFLGLASLSVLDLSRNNLSQVTEENFFGLSELRELYLNDNQIDSTSSGTFQVLGSLEVLSLKGNRLGSLAPRLFLGLGRLEVLDLSYNPLRHLPSPVFKDLQGLKRLACRSCGLRRVRGEMFRYLEHLDDLDLGENYLDSLEPLTFQSLVNLRTLRLDRNQFRILLDGTFRHQSRLARLDLSHGLLAEVRQTALDGLTSLEELDLGHNSLDRLDPGVLRVPGPGLRALSLAGNSLPVDDLNSLLQVLGRVETLNVAGVGLRSFSLPPSPHLTHLNLSGNQLTRLGDEALPPRLKLQCLDLSGNSLYYLEEAAARRLACVPELRLSGNPWLCDLCRLLPLLRLAAVSPTIAQVRCWLPEDTRGREVGSLSPEELLPCESVQPLLLAGLVIGERRWLGLIAAAAALAVFLLLLIVLLVGLLHKRKNVGLYVTNEAAKRFSSEMKEAVAMKKAEKKPEVARRGREVERGRGRASIAVIDEMTKEDVH